MADWRRSWSPKVTTSTPRCGRRGCSMMIQMPSFRRIWPIFAAGAQVATTASYQASIGGFAQAGIEKAEAEQLIRRSVRLAEQARASFDDGQDRWIAGSVGPYGAALADGSEYRGDYDLSVAELRELASAENRVAGRSRCRRPRPRNHSLPGRGRGAACRDRRELVSRAGCRSPVQADRTRAGEPAAEAFSLARDVDEIVAVGSQLHRPGRRVRARPHAPANRAASRSLSIPTAASAGTPSARTWIGPATFQAEDVEEWISGGARLVGGCCRVGPAEIKAIRDLVG